MSGAKRYTGDGEPDDGDCGHATGECALAVAATFRAGVNALDCVWRWRDREPARMQHVAVEAFHALRLRDYGRIDLRVTESGEIYVIEVNPNCYLERESEFARAAREHGLEYPALLARIIELATARYAR